MPEFTVLRRVDAFVRYVAKVNADSPEKAALLAEAKEEDYSWVEDGVVEYDARSFVAVDADGEDIGDPVGDV